MPKMRLGWYAGVSTVLAGSVVISAFFQRPNFYSAMVYLAQSNFCLLVLINFTLLVYSSFVYVLTRLCFGRLRAVEAEQLTERAWFAITETCLAMTIFREEIGAWFIVMFTALVTGKIWGWIGDGRVEVLEQQPPANPRLFHTRLSLSLGLSFVYDVWILRYTINSVIQQARPNMMVMFLFEYAVLATSSWRTGLRYMLTLAEQRIVKAQTQKCLLERRAEVRQQREAMIRQREQAAAAGEAVPENQEPLPTEDDIDEMDIEVPGWAAKGELVLWLDLVTDAIKLGIYVAFFFMLLTFYGLPIHIMRDLFLTSRDFLKRLNALVRYRRAIQEMNKYPDATEEELARENTCIICREEMRPWDPAANPAAIDRVRPKKLPCGHTLHLGCLKSWLERQQVCPTCRSPVTGDRSRTGTNRAALRIQIGGLPRAQAPPANEGDHPPENRQGDGNQGGGQQPGGEPRVYNLGPFRLGFGANNQQVRDLAQQFRMPQRGGNQGATPTIPAPQHRASGDNIRDAGDLLHQAEQALQREVQNLQNRQQELQVSQLLMAELQRLRQRQQQSPQDQAQAGHMQLGNMQPGPMHTGIPPNFHMPPAMPQQPAFLHGQVPLPPFSGLPPLPSLPPRVGSPFMARHVAPPNPTAIPAGSPDLPEGVVIPDGWMLMPLQRLDGANRSATPTTAQPEPTLTQPEPILTQPAEDAMQPEQAPTTNSATSDAATDGSSEPNPTELSRDRPVVEPRPLAAPSPLMPSWPGSAQFFSGGNRLNQTGTVPQQPETSAESAATSSASVEAQGSETREEQDLESGKGKAKAATVEEADDGADGEA